VKKNQRVAEHILVPEVDILSVGVDILGFGMDIPHHILSEVDTQAVVGDNRCLEVVHILAVGRRVVAVPSDINILKQHY
jgi:hypothetical protein